MIESDYKLKFVPLGQPSAATITEDQLDLADPNDPTQYWVPKKAQEVELPLSLLMKFADPNLDYQPNAVQAQRTALPFPTVFSKRRIQISSPIVYSAVDAQQTVEKLLYRMWAERVVYDTILPSTYLNLDPGDNITVVMNNGDTYITRIEQADTGRLLGAPAARLGGRHGLWRIHQPRPAAKRPAAGGHSLAVG